MGRFSARPLWILGDSEMLATDRAVLETTHRGIQCLLIAGHNGWTVWVNGAPILFDLVKCDWAPAFAYADLLIAMAGNGLPQSK